MKEVLKKLSEVSGKYDKLLETNEQESKDLYKEYTEQIKPILEELRKNLGLDKLFPFLPKDDISTFIEYGDCEFSSTYNFQTSKVADFEVNFNLEKNELIISVNTSKTNETLMYKTYKYSLDELDKESLGKDRVSLKELAREVCSLWEVHTKRITEFMTNTNKDIYI